MSFKIPFPLLDQPMSMESSLTKWGVNSPCHVRGVGNAFDAQARDLIVSTYHIWTREPFA